MDTEQFRQRGKEMVDYICEYMESVRGRRVTSSVRPHYLRDLLPAEPPYEPESWDLIMADLEDKLMPGITHWQHPQFHAFFTTRGHCYPSVLADMLSDVMGCFSFSWAASPACTELETLALDWLGKAIGLPEAFLSTSSGGGVIQGSASECVLVCMLAARARTLAALHQQDPSLPEAHLVTRLVAYTSQEAHSCVEKAANVCLVQLRQLQPDDNSALRADTLRQALEEDEARGLVPFFVVATLGTTSCCAFDPLAELGPLARGHSCWLHVDAAYAGCALICPEFQHLLEGVGLVDSFNVNPYKGLLVTFDCSCMWVERLYLQHVHEDKVEDYRHWGVALSRRFRGLKLWCTLRAYGVKGLQAHVRHGAQQAQRFHHHLRADPRFQVCNDVQMGLVCFRLRKGGDQLTEQLLTSLNSCGQIYLSPARVRGRYVIRFFISAQHTSDADVDFSWSLISKHATDLLSTSSDFCLSS